MPGDTLPKRAADLQRSRRPKPPLQANADRLPARVCHEATPGACKFKSRRHHRFRSRGYDLTDPVGAAHFTKHPSKAVRDFEYPASESIVVVPDFQLIKRKPSIRNLFTFEAAPEFIVNLQSR